MAEAWGLSADEAAARDEPNSLSMEEQVRRFRYVVHAEGACSSADRLKQSLGAPALLLKQASPCTEWFEEMFSPWEHYVPVDGSFANVSEAVTWARTHDADAQRIVGAANARARDVLSVGAIYAYADELVKGYAAAYAADAYAPDDGGFTHEFSCDYCAESTSCALRNRSQAVAVSGCAEARTPSTRALGGAALPPDGESSRRWWWVVAGGAASLFMPGPICISAIVAYVAYRRRPWRYGFNPLVVLNDLD